jgi:hypothetical protein
MSDLPVDRPVAGPPAERLARRLETRPTIAQMLHELGRLDLSVYRAIAVTPNPDARRAAPAYLPGRGPVQALVGDRGHDGDGAEGELAGARP